MLPKKFGVISSEFGVFCYETHDSASRILHSAIRSTVELFLSTLLILTLTLFCAFTPVLSQDGSCIRMASSLYQNSRFPDPEGRGLGQIKESGDSLERSLFKKWEHEKSEDRLSFPLKGYGPRAIGGKEGSGYQIQGYDFFDGNQHKGHPGHDIFIRDKNQDGLDDVTGRPVDVISVSSGMVVSVNLNWEPSSPIRGGNYIWIYEPIKSRYYYYAHLNEIFVNVGQIVSKGDRLGTVGRTGVKAYPKSSPTHLHFVVHQSIDGYPKPINPYLELVSGNQQ